MGNTPTLPTVTAPLDTQPHTRLASPYPCRPHPPPPSSALQTPHPRSQPFSDPALPPFWPKPTLTSCLPAFLCLHSLTGSPQRSRQRDPAIGQTAGPLAALPWPHLRAMRSGDRAACRICPHGRSTSLTSLGSGDLAAPQTSQKHVPSGPLHLLFLAR